MGSKISYPASHFVFLLISQGISLGGSDLF